MGPIRVVRKIRAGGFWPRNPTSRIAVNDAQVFRFPRRRTRDRFTINFGQIYRLIL